MTAVLGHGLEYVPAVSLLAAFVYQIRTRDRVAAYHRVPAPWPFCPTPRRG